MNINEKNQKLKKERGKHVYGEHWDGAIMLKICKMWLGCISKHSLADLAC